MKITSIYKNIIHLDFPNKKEMNLTMSRLMSFYESNDINFRNKYMSLFDILKTCMGDDGKITYFTWSGFNIPSECYLRFLDEFSPKNDFNEYEQIMIGLIGNLALSNDFYIIASIPGNNSAKNHEYCHALFNLDEGYRESALKLVRELPQAVYDAVKKGLLDLGYSEYVMDDEVNAYLATSNKKYLKKTLKYICTDETLKPFKELSAPILSKINKQVKLTLKYETN